MKARTMTITICVAALTGALTATAALKSAATPPVKGKSAITEEERARRREARRKARIERWRLEGGFVQAPVTGNVVRLVNAQSLADAKVFEDTQHSMRSGLGFGIEIVKADPGAGAATFREGKAAVVVAAVEKDGQPALLVAPEAAWAEVNVKALAADGPDADKLQGRVMREMWRGLCYVLGAANSMFQPCVMRDVRSLKDLDDIVQFAPNPEPFGKMTDSAKGLGIDRARVATYYRACLEGWAETPTNDIQKACWERARSEKERGPTQPITIPPPKR